MIDIQLRPYQRDFIDNVRRQFICGNKRVVGVAPCGAGKTVMTAFMIKEALKRGKRSIFFVHRKELIAQTAKTFTQLGIPFGIIEPSFPMHLNLPVQIASVQTLARRVKKIPAPNFLICDECHHILANTYKTITRAYPDAYLLGVTATPQRMGGVTLADAFDVMVESLSVNELIGLGNLTKFQYFAAKVGVDLSNVRTSFGEYNQRDLADVMRGAKIIGDIVGEYKRLAPDKSAICYCVNVAHSKEVAQAFNEAGIPAAHCDGDTPATVRNKIVDDFRRGNLKILCNAELFGEGFDVPNMQAVILARPTQSLTLFIQQSMRPLRPDPDDPNKVAVIIDHVQNFARHGLPNSPQQWSLNPKNSSDARLCIHCGKLVVPVKRSDKIFCPVCNHEFKKSKGGSGLPNPREWFDVDGQIVSLNVSFDTNNQKKPVPTSPEDFMAIRGSRKIGWVAHQAAQFAWTFTDFKHIADVCGYKKGWAWYQWQNKKNSLADIAKSPTPC